jgi:tetratricopeptide (TPR) repeat protein
MQRHSRTPVLLIVAAATAAVAFLSAPVRAPAEPARDGEEFFRRGQANVRAGDFRHAVKNFDAAIAVNRLDDRAYQMRCWTRAVLGLELRHALADCNEVLRLNPHNFQVFDARGLAYLRLGEFRRAIADFDTVLRFDPRLASSLYGRALTKRRIGDVAGAGLDEAAAMGIEPGIAERFARYGLR